MIQIEQLSGLKRIGEDNQGREFPVMTAEAPEGWRVAARAASKVLPGMIFPGALGFTHVCGSRVEWYTTPDHLPHVLAAREVCSMLRCPPGGTVGGCCRRLLEWVAEGTRKNDVPQEWRLANWNYAECRPGMYRQCCLFDVQSCYYQLYRRLPSLRCGWDQGRIAWHALTHDEECRRRDLDGLIAREKLIRNALVGVMWGGSSPTPYYSEGEKRFLQPKPGRFPRAAMLIYRTAWELTRTAAIESDAVFACVDSIITRELGDAWHRGGVDAWRSVGLQVRMQEAGPADVCYPGCYAVGGKKTFWYRQGVRKRIYVPRPERVEPELYRLWL